MTQTEKIKNLRVALDVIAKIIIETRGEPNPHSVNPWGDLIPTMNIRASFDSLQLGSGWLGKLLGEMGEETPYKKDGERKTKADIEPRADTSTIKKPILVKIDDKIHVANANVPREFNPSYSITTIERLDWLREELQWYINIVRDMDLDRREPNEAGGTDLKKATREMSICRTNCWTHLAEAKMHLGFELARIRDEKI